MNIHWTKTAYSIAKIITAMLFIVALAQLNIDLEMGAINIPITGQSLAVLLVAVLLDKYQGLMAVLLYLALGLVGVPVFADGKSGVGIFTGSTGGYLVGFALAAWLLSSAFFELIKVPIMRAFVAMLTGTAIILGVGFLWLSYLHGIDIALKYGVYPLLAGAAIKIAIGVGVVLVNQYAFNRCFKQ